MKKQLKSDLECEKILFREGDETEINQQESGQSADFTEKFEMNDDFARLENSIESEMGHLKNIKSELTLLKGKFKSNKSANNQRINHPSQTEEPEDDLLSKIKGNLNLIKRSNAKKKMSSEQNALLAEKSDKNDILKFFDINSLQKLLKMNGDKSNHPKDDILTRSNEQTDISNTSTSNQFLKSQQSQNVTTKTSSFKEKSDHTEKNPQRNSQDFSGLSLNEIEKQIEILKNLSNKN